MRNRSSAVAITTNTKKKITSEIGFNDDLNEKDKMEKFSNFMEKEILPNNKLNKRTSLSNENIIDIPPPNYLDIKKEYFTKYDKVNKLL